MATPGTAREIEADNPDIEVQRVKKLAEGHPNLLDHLVDHDVALILNTPSGKGARTDEGRIRAAAVQAGVPCITTIQAAEAMVKALEALQESDLTILALQDRFAMA
jgi:carbamoyl-phosphate synthase large subunit